MVSLSVRLSIAAVSIGRLQPAHMTPGWIVGGGAAVAFSMGPDGASPLASASGSDQVGSGIGEGPPLLRLQSQAAVISRTFVALIAVAGRGPVVLDFALIPHVRPGPVVIPQPGERRSQLCAERSLCNRGETSCCAP